MQNTANTWENRPRTPLRYRAAHYRSVDLRMQTCGVGGSGFGLIGSRFPGWPGLDVYPCGTLSPRGDLWPLLSRDILVTFRRIPVVSAGYIGWASGLGVAGEYAPASPPSITVPDSSSRILDSRSVIPESCSRVPFRLRSLDQPERDAQYLATSYPTGKIRQIVSRDGPSTRPRHGDRLSVRCDLCRPWRLGVEYAPECHQAL